MSDKVWLAAAIDGEGSLCLNKKTRRVQLVVYNTSADFAEGTSSNTVFRHCGITLCGKKTSVTTQNLFGESR